MRELKFRAWDKNGKRFLNGFYLYTGSCVGNAEIGVWNNAETDIVFDDYPQLILSQYTGLKDKNGKEIYEGDILGVIETEIVVEGSIEYVGAAFMLRAYNAFMEPMGVWILGNTNSNFLGYRNPSSFEIIGNIHENPELKGLM
jgi:uncharacterized phage protein (TIGR01671 family)